MAQEFAKRFYKSKAWRKVRNYVYERDHGLCQDCLKKGIITSGLEVHHTVSLTPGNISDPDIALNPDRLVTLCYECHRRRHEGDRSVLADGLCFDAEGNVIESPPIERNMG